MRLLFSNPIHRISQVADRFKTDGRELPEQVTQLLRLHSPSMVSVQNSTPKSVTLKRSNYAKPSNSMSKRKSNPTMVPPSQVQILSLLTSWTVLSLRLQRHSLPQLNRNEQRRLQSSLFQSPRLRVLARRRCSRL